MSAQEKDANAAGTVIRALTAGRRSRPWRLTCLFFVLGIARGTAAQDSPPAPTKEDPSSGAPSGRAEPEILPPQILGEGFVAYPQGATEDAIVSLQLLIGTSGRVLEASVVEGEEPFATAALDAARGWKFSPATVGGVPQAARILFRVEFQAPVEFPPSQPPGATDAALPTGLGSTDTEPTEPELVVHVEGVRRPGVARVMSDLETQIIPGAEGDPVRAIEAMPGTVPILGSGPFIGLRGASPGMVGYEYDGISIPYLFHLARGTAVVHPWLVESATIHGSGGPARLGRSGGGFVEAHAAQPQGQFRAGGRLRLTDAAGGVESPYADGRGSVMVAGRYSYTRPMVSLIAPEFTLNFWDYQGRIQHRISEQERLELLTFGAGDRSAQELPDGSEEDLFRGQFHRIALRYRYEKEDGGHDRIGLILGHDRWDGRPSPIRPHSSTIRLAYDGSTPHSENVWVEYGVDVGVRLQVDYYFIGTDAVARYNRSDVELGSFVDVTYEASRRTTMALGVRSDLYGSEESPRSAENTAFYVQPRFSISHQASDVARLHQGFGLSAQLRSPSQRPPGRTYSADGGLERVALSDFGVELRLPADTMFDVAGFHNAFFHVGDIESLYFIDGQNYDRQRGQGQAVGLEVSLRRTFGSRLRGFVSYTLSHSYRSIGRVRAPAEFDRPHVLDAAFAYDFGKGIRLSTRGTYYSGFPARVASYDQVEGRPRSTPYYQVDWQLSKRWEYVSGAWWGLSLGVLNTTLNSEANDKFCDVSGCREELVGPATIPTLGIEGEL